MTITGSGQRYQVCEGGADATQGLVTYDQGTISATINGQLKSISYGNGDTAELVAQRLAASVNDDCSFPFMGNSYANTRINVGELAAPLNGSGFINDPKLKSKLSVLRWYLRN